MRSTFLSMLLLTGPLMTGTAHAQVVLDFDGLTTSPGGGVHAGDPLVEDGFRLSMITGTGILALEDGWQNDRGSSNGTTTVYTYVNGGPDTSVRLQAVSGAPFSISSIDVAEVFNVGDFAYPWAVSTLTITGDKGGVPIQDVVAIDGVSDGQGGAVDFQTHSFSSAWTDLTSVTFAATNGQSNVYFNFDNIVLGGCGPFGQTYGAGCPGSGGAVPTLTALRCPQSTVSVLIGDGLGGANAFLFLGTGQTSVPMGGGCSLLVTPALGPIGPLPLGGSGAGQGTLTLTVPDPVVLASVTVTLQAFVDDGGGAMPFSNSAGRQLTFSP